MKWFSFKRKVPEDEDSRKKKLAEAVFTELKEHVASTIKNGGMDGILDYEGGTSYAGTPSRKRYIILVGDKTIDRGGIDEAANGRIICYIQIALEDVELFNEWRGSEIHFRYHTPTSDDYQITYPLKDIDEIKNFITQNFRMYIQGILNHEPKYMAVKKQGKTAA